MSNDTTQQAPYITIYEWDTPHGIHRSFSPGNWNGWEPTRAVRLVEATQPTQDDPKAEVLALREREHRLGLMLMKMREAWWPFVHSAGMLASNHARGLLKESTEVLSEDATPVIDMVLYCPKCGKQHVDAPESDAEYTARLYESSWWELGGAAPRPWGNPPHRSHKCHHCGCIWRPADVPTNGVARITTQGKADTWFGGWSGRAVAAEASQPTHLATSDPEGHRQAIADHEADQPTQAEAPSERERRELQEVANRLREVGYHNAANNTERNIADIKSGIIPHAVIGAALATQQAVQGWKQIGYTCGDGDCGRIHDSPAADGSYSQPVYVPASPAAQQAEPQLPDAPARETFMHGWEQAVQGEPVAGVLTDGNGVRIDATPPAPGQVERDREHWNIWTLMLDALLATRMSVRFKSLSAEQQQQIDAAIRAARSSEGGGNEHSR